LQLDYFILSQNNKDFRKYLDDCRVTFREDNIHVDLLKLDTMDTKFMERQKLSGAGSRNTGLNIVLERTEFFV